MKAKLLSFLLYTIGISGIAQNSFVTFTGTGAATQINSVTATNLTTNQSVTFPGNETLVLSINTGIPSVSELINMGIVFPNPFSGQATFSTIVQKPQTVYLKVQNLVGRVVAQLEVFVQQGENEFALSVNASGIYTVSLTTEKGTASYKVICADATEAENGIQYIGPVSGYHENLSKSRLKNDQTVYILGYKLGDVILYRCKSGIYTSIKTDSHIYSKDYEVEFVPCADRDGKNYSIVKIGRQTWMAENLAYLRAVSPSVDGSVTSPFYYVYGYDGTNIGAAKTTANYTDYGVLYNWEAATISCPSGWHLPSDAEWTTLTDYFGGSGKSELRETGPTHWGVSDTERTNAGGFTARAGGYRDLPGKFLHLGGLAFFWSSTENNYESTAWFRSIGPFTVGVNSNIYNRSYALSVRCLLGPVIVLARLTTDDVTEKTETSASSGGNVTNDGGEFVTARGVCWNTTGTPTITDNKTTNGSGLGAFTGSITGLTAGTNYCVRAYATISAGTAYGEERYFTTTGGGGDGTLTDSRDGHVYKFITINTQSWMAENLAYLPSVSSPLQGSGITPYYYVYDYKGYNVNEAKSNNPNYTTYGVLYNWKAATTACPSGWHLPSDAEWTTLTDYLGSSASGKMKEVGTTHWRSPNNGATNESGFTALPGGYASSAVGCFDLLGLIATFWSASENAGSNPWSRYLYNYDASVHRDVHERGFGYSIRCMKN